MSWSFRSRVLGSNGTENSLKGVTTPNVKNRTLSFPVADPHGLAELKRKRSGGVPDHCVLLIG
jgi:hypothetical protein